MAQTVSVDNLAVLEADERHGGLRRMVRRALVSGVDATNWEALTEALDDTNLPQYGSHLTESLSDNAYDLTLIERRVRLVESDPTKVWVDLVYENFVDLEEDLDDPRGGYVTGEVRCNLQQKTSNLDIYGSLVEVSHTYPADDPNHPSETLTQGGEFQYYEPQRTIFIRGIKQTRTPWLIANAIIGRVNSTPFSGEVARTWLCTACSWKLSWAGRISGGVRENRYFMNFEFQYDADTWDPTVTFIDDVTGKPPPNLIPNTGYKTVEKMPSADFDSIIGAPLQGG
jgi:hypothetical protein